MLSDPSQLQRALDATATDSGRRWLAEKLSGLRCLGANLQALAIALAMARRKVGAAPLQGDVDGTLVHWNTADAARVLMLLAVRENCEDSALIEEAYRQGDEYEREAVLKGLVLLDPSGGLKAMAVDACRTNVATMMSSIALANAYPARFFSEHEFNQMVLKCLFMGFDISAVEGLGARRNPSLSRMCYDYLRERTAAGRDFPPSLWLALRIRDVAGAYDLFTRCLAAEGENHRYYATLSLCRQAADDESLTEVLRARLELESNDNIRRLISAACAKTRGNSA